MATRLEKTDNTGSSIVLAWIWPQPDTGMTSANPEKVTVGRKRATNLAPLLNSLNIYINYEGPKKAASGGLRPMALRKLLIAVVSDGFNRTTLKRLHALLDVFVRCGLIVDEGVATFFLTLEKSRSGFAAKIAVNALLIHVKFPASVVFPLICFVGHEKRESTRIRGSVKREHGQQRPLSIAVVGLVLPQCPRNLPPMPSDRPYQRSDYPYWPTAAWIWLIAAMIAGFVLQLAMLSPWLRGSTGYIDQLRLSVRSFEQAQVWTLLTHGFLHNTSFPLHIVFTLLTLTVLGREVEPQLGRLRFALLFGGSLVIGGLCWLIMNWKLGGAHFGPTSALLGLAVVLARVYEDQKLTFMPLFVFSVTLRPMHLVYGLAVVETLLLLVFELAGTAASIGFSPSAHLGGMATGLFYFRFFHANRGWDRAASSLAPSWVQNRKSLEPAPAAATTPPQSRDPLALKADVDRILDKINSEGFGSLTPDEKRTLNDAKSLLSKP